MKVKNLIVFAIFSIVILNITLSGEQINKVLISGTNIPHDENVKAAFLIGYSSYNGTNFSGSVDLYYDYPAGMSNSFSYADANGYEVIVRSMTGLNSAITEADHHTDITAFMPAGSNSHVLVFNGDVQESPIIITGAGDENNETGYKVEFFSIDPITADDLSSFSNGYIAGQICYLANELNKSIDEVRQIARITASNCGTCDPHDGFGKVEIGSALGVLPVELVSFEAELDIGFIELNWVTVTEVNNFGFEVQRLEPSLNGFEEWETLGFVQGNGTTNSCKEYLYDDSDIPDAIQVSYRLKQIDNDGTFAYSKVVTIDLSTITSIDETKLLDFALEQNYPNPFNPSTTIKFTLPQMGNTTLKVYNIIGEEVAELINNVMLAGRHEVNFDAGKLSSGTYIYKIKINDQFSSMKKMLLIK